MRHSFHRYAAIVPQDLILYYNMCRAVNNSQFRAEVVNI